MRSTNRILPLVACLLMAVVPARAVAQPDAADCKDHPMLTRMPDFYITMCEGSPFDRHDFSSETGALPVEGRKVTMRYALRNGVTAPSAAAVVRNHINAIRKIGGTVVYDGGSRATLKVTKDKQETWIGVDAGAGYEYQLDIIEKGDMHQDVIATAEGMTSDIVSTGHAALYGLYFDTGKSEIKPESEPALTEIAKLLKLNGAMRLFVVGHTDNVGSLASNMALSKARAESVIRELTTRHGVSAGQLAAHGVGSLSPVASNTAESGRALNRRVELVAQ